MIMQVTKHTAMVLEVQGFQIEKRGEVFVKGKGNLITIKIVNSFIFIS